MERRIRMIIEHHTPAYEDVLRLDIDLPHRNTRFSAVMSTAAQGDMSIDSSSGRKHREEFCRVLGIDACAVYSLPLSHSRTVEQIGDGSRLDPAVWRKRIAERGGADGLVVRDTHCVAGITVADCMPIWILDGSTGNFALLHSGWKGTGILEVAVRLMTGSNPGDTLDDTVGKSAPAAVSAAAGMTAIFGPSIDPCCYNVPESRAEQFSRQFGSNSVLVDRGGVHRAEEEPRFRLDLRAANLGIAERLGIGRVIDVAVCTSCDLRLGSFRREGPEGFTRMLALAGFFPAGVDGLHRY